MIPRFDERGYLPPGIHLASLGEFETQFGQRSEIRRAQMDSIRWLYDLVRRAGGRRLIINGSFTTDLDEPNDVDCAVLLDDDFPVDDHAAEELSSGLPFVDRQLLEQFEFDILVNEFFATDRDENPKGVIEISL